MKRGGTQKLLLYIENITGIELRGAKVPISSVFCSFCLCLSTFYPYLVVASTAKHGFDNAFPRHTHSSLRQTSRLFSAHLNQNESFPGFAAAVLSAVALGKGSSARVAALALLHVTFRTFYLAFYYMNVPTLRTQAFVASWHCVALIFAESIKS